MKPETKRLMAAVFLAPLLIGLMGGGVGLLAEGWKMALYFFVATGVIVFAFMVVYGVPVHLILKRMKCTGILFYMIASIPAALIIDRLNAEYLGLQISFDAVPGGIVSLLTLICTSALTAAVAWFIARPDKNEAASGAL